MMRRLAFLAVALALLIAVPPPGQIGQAQGSLETSAEAYFSGGPKTVTAADLFENLNDGDTDNNPTIVSLRSAEDYAKGHIPGAVNMNVKEMFTLDNLATLPPNRDIVVVCYTGQTAAQATAALNLLGYEAYSLLHGMSAWTTDPDVFVNRFDPEKHANDFAVETVPNEPGGPYDLPEPLAPDLVTAVQAYFSAGPKTLAAADLFDNLNDGDADNNPTIISLRSAEDYAKGHIPGAVNMSVKELFLPDNLATLPPERDLVVVCYTGQTAGQATAALNILGYDAYSLLFGMSSWTTDPEVFVSRFDPAKAANDFPLDTEAYLPGGPYELPFDQAPAPSEVAPPAALPVAPVNLADTANEYFGQGPQTITAADLFDNLNDGDTGNDPYIVSLRSAEHYALGHIPGAVNMNVKEMFTLDNLATLPPNRDIIVVCYTGQTAAQATAALNMLGYEAFSLIHGMSAWTTNPDVFVNRFDPEKHANDFAVETMPNEPGGPYDLPQPLAPDLVTAVQAYFSAGPKTLAAADLFDNLNDGDADNNPTIISLRSAEDYAKGHIPGAVNMSVKELFLPDNLATLPPERDLVVVCYTGQTAGQATVALNLLGYEAYSLLFGMSSWTSDPDVFVSRFDPEKAANDFTLDTEPYLPGGPYELPFAVGGAGEPGQAPTAPPEGAAPVVEAPAQNCMNCHTDQSSLMELAEEEQEVVSEESAGEG